MTKHIQEGFGWGKYRSRQMATEFDGGQSSSTRDPLHLRRYPPRCSIQSQIPRRSRSAQRSPPTTPLSVGAIRPPANRHPPSPTSSASPSGISPRKHEPGTLSSAFPLAKSSPPPEPICPNLSFFNTSELRYRTWARPNHSLRTYPRTNGAVAIFDAFEPFTQAIQTRIPDS
jgi:hypothetical protein